MVKGYSVLEKSYNWGMVRGETAKISSFMELSFVRGIRPHFHRNKWKINFPV